MARLPGMRPGRRGPDDDGRACQLERIRNIAVAFGASSQHRKLHPRRIARVVVVLDLGFRQRRLLHHAPHHRLRPAIERAVHGELHQLRGDDGLGLVGHGRVVVLPVAFDAEPLELLALHADPVLGKSAALLAELVDRHLVLVLALGAILLLDLPFDRQAVAVPSGHVVGIEAQHLLAARHHVLQDLVQRRADVDVAVGVRRTVVQHELGPAHGGLAQPVIEPDPGPPLQQLRLALRQARAHGKVRLRQK